MAFMKLEFGGLMVIW